MSSLALLLRRNRNYRYTWMGQVVSEIGDYFNNVAVLALIMQQSGSGLVVSGFWLARAIPAVIAGPIAGVLLDRLDRRRVMIASDLIRAAIALAFVLTIRQRSPWLLYGLSAALMFASPFFTSGRSAILPAIAEAEDLHTANSLTQTTGWATLSAGSLLGGISAARFGYQAAFILNALSFVFSAWCVWRIEAPRGFQAKRAPAARGRLGGWSEYLDGLAYLRSVPLLLGIGMISVGWALGGGAAQVLFALFGEQVFHRGPSGIGALCGIRRHRTADRRRARSHGRPPRLVRRVQAHRDRRLSLSRRHLHALQPGRILSRRAPLSDVFPRGHGGHHGAQYLATPAPHSRRVPRPGVCHHGDDALAGDDFFDGRGGNCVRIHQPAHHRTGGWGIWSTDCLCLGLVRLDRPPSGAITCGELFRRPS